MSLQAEYDMFCRGYWAEQDAEQCLCHGRGWALSDLDTWHQCPIHFNGQIHPEVAMEEPSDGNFAADVVSAPVSLSLLDNECEGTSDEIPF